MKTLVVGASGATGRHVVQEQLDQGIKVKIVVRSIEKLPATWKEHQNLEIVNASLLDLNDVEMIKLIEDCTSIVSCLGHNLSLKGIYGKPRQLVTQATKNLCNAVKNSSRNHITKFVLMNTTGNRNKDLVEPISFGQKLLLGLIRLLLPPHVDNEKAAEFLRSEIGQNNKSIEWVAVRPDTLINLDVVTEYEAFASPTRSALFNPGKTSRINVGNFMSNLITNEELWNQWKGKMPVLYNKSE